MVLEAAEFLQRYKFAAYRKFLQDKPRLYRICLGLYALEYLSGRLVFHVVAAVQDRVLVWVYFIPCETAFGVLRD